MSKTLEDRILSDLDFASGRLSTQVRQIALGSLAIVWAILVSKDSNMPNVLPRSLFRVGILSVLTMTLDFGQYVAGYFASRRAWEDFRAGGDGKYNRKWWSWRLRGWLFWAKLVGCSLNVAYLLSVLAGAAFA